MIRFRCVACGKSSTAPDGLAGKKVACPRCHEASRLPAATPGPEPQPGPGPTANVPQETPGLFPSALAAARVLLPLFGGLGAVGLLVALVWPFLGWDGWITSGAAAVAGCSVVALLATLHGLGTGCPACGRWWSRTETGSEVGDRELLESEGQTVARSVKRTHYRCECCGHAWSVNDTDEYPAPARSVQRARR